MSEMDINFNQVTFLIEVPDETNRPIEGRVLQRRYTTVRQMVEQLLELDQELFVAVWDDNNGTNFEPEVRLTKVDKYDRFDQFGPNLDDIYVLLC